jgi:hypothetical protein
MEPEPDPSRGSEPTAACGSRVRVAIPPGGRPEMLTGFTNANDAAGWNARTDDRRPVVFLLRVSDRSLRDQSLNFGRRHRSPAIRAPARSSNAAKP